MNTKEVLRQLGVRDDTLTDEERASLDAEGYLPLHDVLTSEEAGRLAERVDAILAEEGDAAGRELHASPMIKHPTEKGAARLSDLVNKDAAFDVCFTHPRVLAAIAHVLDGPFKLSSLNSRASLPGHGLQALHADWPRATTPGVYYVCNSIWLLDDFTSENGATRLVPGTHRSGRTPTEALDNPQAAHPNEIQLVAPRGTVVIFNSHTWHGGTLNQTDVPRRAIHSYFCRRDQVQQIDQQRYIRQETWARLSPAARFILDVRDTPALG